MGFFDRFKREKKEEKVYTCTEEDLQFDIPDEKESTSNYHQESVVRNEELEQKINHAKQRLIDRQNDEIKAHEDVLDNFQNRVKKLSEQSSNIINNDIRKGAYSIYLDLAKEMTSKEFNPEEIYNTTSGDEKIIAAYVNLYAAAELADDNKLIDAYMNLMDAQKKHHLTKINANKSNKANKAQTKKTYFEELLSPFILDIAKKITSEKFNLAEICNRADGDEKIITAYVNVYGVAKHYETVQELANDGKHDDTDYSDAYAYADELWKLLGHDEKPYSIKDALTEAYANYLMELVESNKHETKTTYFEQLFSPVMFDLAKEMVSKEFNPVEIYNLANGDDKIIADYVNVYGVAKLAEDGKLSKPDTELAEAYANYWMKSVEHDRFKTTGLKATAVAKNAIRSGIATEDVKKSDKVEQKTKESREGDTRNEQ